MTDPTNPLLPQGGVLPSSELSPLAPPTTDPRAIVQNLPRAQTAFVNKYSNPAIRELPEDVVKALARFDFDRVRRGQNPLTERQSVHALRTLLTGESSVQPREETNPIKRVVGNTLSDVVGITTGLIRLPGALISEAREIPNLPANLQQAVSTAENPLEAVENIARTPVVRFLPGAYIAENIQDPGELLEHPLLTALDVAPFASRAARGSGVFQAAQSRALEAGTRVPRPLPTLALHRLDRGGALQPNAVGNVLQSLGTTLGATRAGRWGRAAFGGTARETMRVINQSQEAMKARLRGEGLDTSARAVDRFIERKMEFDKLYEDLDPDTRLKLDKLAPEPDINEITRLSPREMSYIDDARELQREFGTTMGLESGDLLAAVIDGSEHIFDRTTGRRVLRSQARVRDIEQVNGWLDRMNNTDIPASQLIDDLTTNRPDSSVLATSTGKSVADIHDRMLVDGLEVRGYDVSAAREAIKAGRPVTRDMLTPRATVFDDALPRIRSSARTNPVIAQISTAITRGDWRLALEKADSAAARTLLGENHDAFVADLRARRNLATTNERFTKEFGDTNLARKRAQLDRIESRSVPANFYPLVTREAFENLTRHVEDIYATDPNLNEYLQLARERNVGAIPDVSATDFRYLKRDAILNWRRMAQELGEHQPVWVHRVSPSQALRVSHPRVVPGRTPPLTQARPRTFDATPHVPDMSIALDHQAVEWLQRIATEEVEQTFAATYGRTIDALSTQYARAARSRANARANQLGMHPDDLVIDELNKAISREWAPFRHDRRIPTTAGPDDIFIPRHLADNFDKLAEVSRKVTTDFVDPALNVFRTSVLALSPRWHVYNVGGGAVLGAFESPLMFRKFNQARALLADAGMRSQLPPGVLQGGVTIPSELFARWSAEASPAQKAVAAWNFKGGQKARKLYDQYQQSAVRTAGKKLVQGSYDFNARVDDLYRVMAYLEGRDNALTKGMTREAATKAGESLARRILPVWDEATPFERSIMRYWMPFAIWNEFIIKYAARYPLDHPFRAAVTSNIVRHEIEDQGDTLPLSLLSTFFLGEPDEDGGIQSINLAAMNPFRDVGNWFSTLGFVIGQENFEAVVSNINPAISLLLEQLGVDTRSGTAELFPEVQVDPETGQLVAVSGADNLVTSAVTSFVPQSQVLLHMVGASNEFREIARTNPEAANRAITSALGLPILFRDINVEDEQIKIQTRRLEEQDAARSRALSTGNFDLLNKYPNLRPLNDAVGKWIAGEQLTPEEAAILESYNLGGDINQFIPPPPEPPPNPLSAVLPVG